MSKNKELFINERQKEMDRDFFNGLNMTRNPLNEVEDFLRINTKLRRISDGVNDGKHTNWKFYKTVYGSYEGEDFIIFLFQHRVNDVMKVELAPKSPEEIYYLLKPFCDDRGLTLKKYEPNRQNK